MHRNTRLSIALVMGAALLAAGPAQGQSAGSQMCEENCVCPDGSAAQAKSADRSERKAVRGKVAKKKTKKRVTTEAPSATVTPPSAEVEGPSATVTPPSAEIETLGSSDASFIRQAALDSFAQIKLGSLAMQRGSNEEVREMGRRMVSEHCNTLAALIDMARSRGIALEDELDDETSEQLRLLSGVSGAQFDCVYLSYLTDRHNEAVALFESQASTGTDPVLQNWARSQLPTLRSHQDMARTQFNNSRRTF